MLPTGPTQASCGVVSASAALQERLARLRASDAFRNYEHARERVLEMRAQIAASPDAFVTPLVGLLALVAMFRRRRVGP